MSDWVHCNTCFVQPANDRRFFLTSCGHIFCENCMRRRTDTEKCCMCSQKSTSILLSSKLKPEVEAYFINPMDSLKNSQRQFFKVLDFQQSHQRRLFHHLREQCSKITEKARQKIQQLQHENTQCRHKLQELQQENAMLKQTLSRTGFDPAQLGNRLTPIPAHLTSEARQTSTPQPNSRGFDLNIPSYPKRLQMRTPPSQGRIGVVKATPSPVRVPTRTGLTPAVVPMQTSPNVRSTPTNQNNRFDVYHDNRLDAPMGDAPLPSNLPRPHQMQQQMQQQHHRTVMESRFAEFSRMSPRGGGSSYFSSSSRPSGGP